MKRLTGLIVIILIFLEIACDDITRPPQDPSAKAEKEAREQIPVPIKEPEITKGEMIEIYNLLVDIRNKLMNWHRKLYQLQKSNDPYFSANRQHFREWVASQNTVLSVTEEKISPVKNKLPNEHPATSLWLAMQQLKRMMGDYMNYYHLKKPLHPEYGKEMKKWLDDFELKMKTYKTEESSEQKSTSEESSPEKSAPAKGATQ